VNVLTLLKRPILQYTEWSVSGGHTVGVFKNARSTGRIFFGEITDLAGAA